jgi:hypothetical protein
MEGEVTLSGREESAFESYNTSYTICDVTLYDSTKKIVKEPYQRCQNFGGEMVLIRRRCALASVVENVCTKKGRMYGVPRYSLFQLSSR